MNIDPSIVASSTLSELGTRAWHTMQLLTVTVLKLYIRDKRRVTLGCVCTLKLFS